MWQLLSWQPNAIRRGKHMLKAAQGLFSQFSFLLSFVILFFPCSLLTPDIDSFMLRLIVRGLLEIAYDSAFCGACSAWTEECRSSLLCFVFILEENNLQKVFLESLNALIIAVT